MKLQQPKKDTRAFASKTLDQAIVLSIFQGTDTIQITMDWNHYWKSILIFLLHFVAFFHVASLFSTGVDNEKVGVDSEKALELDNRIIFSYFSLILKKK